MIRKYIAVAIITTALVLTSVLSSKVCTRIVHFTFQHLYTVQYRITNYRFAGNTIWQNIVLPESSPQIPGIISSCPPVIEITPAPFTRKLTQRP
jgi:hypothetical protein